MATYYFRSDNVFSTTQTSSNLQTYNSLAGDYYAGTFSIKVEIGNSSWTTISNFGAAQASVAGATWTTNSSSGAISYSFPGKASMSTGDKLRITVRNTIGGQNSDTVFTSAALNKTSLAAETWSVYYYYLHVYADDYGDGEDEAGTDQYLNYGSSTYNSRIEGITLSEAGGGSVITKTQTAIGRISKQLTKTQTGRSRIAKITTKTQPAIAMISFGGTEKTKEQTGISRIQKQFTKTQSAVSRIALEKTKTQPAHAWISDGSKILNQSCNAHIFNPSVEFDHKIVLVKESDGTTLSTNTWLNAGNCGVVSDTITGDTILRLKSNTPGYHRASTTLSIIGTHQARFKIATTSDFAGQDWDEDLTVGNVDYTGMLIYLRGHADNDNSGQKLQAQITFTNTVVEE